MVADYPGTVIVVSHDRDFLDRVATSILISDGDGNWTEYAGGYADMVAQRGRGVGTSEEARKPAKKPAPKPQAAPPTPERRKKLSFKQQHALKTLPDQIAKLQGEIAVAEAKLADAGLFTRDPGAFKTLTGRLEAAQTELAAAEDEWLELELLREELGG